MGLCSHKDVTAFRGWKLKWVKFSLIRNSNRISTGNAPVQPGANLKTCCVLWVTQDNGPLLPCRISTRDGLKPQNSVRDLNLVIKLVTFQLNKIQNEYIIICLFLPFCFRTLTVGKSQSAWLLPKLRPTSQRQNGTRNISCFQGFPVGLPGTSFLQFCKLCC